MQTRLKKQLVDLASAPYRDTGNFNHGWARGKLSRDPIFAALLEQSVFSDGSSVLDLGCGRGLLAAWLLAAEQLAGRGDWPGDGRPPLELRFRGVELIAREVECGNRALRPRYGERVRLCVGDMRTADLGEADVVALLDVLHYIAYAEQERLLDRVRAALGPGGLLLTRVGDAGSRWRSALSQIVDVCVALAQGHRCASVWCRPLTAWITALEARGFVVQALPMSAGTPLANVMLICRVR